jgi:RNA polymerase sigma-70 factor (ECF subfamily)
MRDKQEDAEKTIMEPGENELPDLLATNLRGYFELLVLRYASQLYAFALHWIGNPTDAEDIVQGAFERAFITLDNYPAPLIRTLNLRPWLYKVTLNVSRNYISRSRLHTISLELVEDEDMLERDEDWHRQPELVVESAERRRELEALVATLAPCYRDAISLCFFGDLSYQETANVLNKSIGTIKFYVHRGIELLRKRQESQMNEVR